MENLQGHLVRLLYPKVVLPSRYFEPYKMKRFPSTGGLSKYLWKNAQTNSHSVSKRPTLKSNNHESHGMRSSVMNPTHQALNDSL